MTESAPKAPNSLRAIRRAREITLEQLGEMVGTDPSTINKLERGRMRLNERWLLPLAKALGVSVDDILASPEDMPGIVPHDMHDAHREREIARQPGIGSDSFRPAAVPVPAPQDMPNDVPVLGTAAGSHLRGAFQMDEANIVDWVRRPPALTGAKKAYALYVEGSSMAPEHNAGDLRFVHPGRPPRIGDTVIVQVRVGANEPIEASIGHYLKKTPTMIVIGKLNPEAQVQLKLDTVIDIHKVLTMNELFGV
ncbi:helix-turn-helix domain-containing protein [Chelativorans sp. ZYF759]|uniref:XRE family transcriptional regulator n=1 Tax=Chelativorans sp. ZYF759 TaxID=2692213 RepID=UPI00145DE309|nr:helix-turn-helix domain-containing protein [Chelativorans sp. ZYF759]NMG39839.1 helix-turn-helix domain-containing protein [Chelativorans sp. ZYF759]